MPAPLGPQTIPRTRVEIGPEMAAASVGGIQMRGFFTMLGICSIDVPTPCATRPPILFSR